MLRWLLVVLLLASSVMSVPSLSRRYNNDRLDQNFAGLRRLIASIPFQPRPELEPLRLARVRRDVNESGFDENT